MEAQYYYRLDNDTENNYEVSDRYLQVNCTGYLILPHQFITKTSRKDYYLQYLLSGNMDVMINGDYCKMKPGDFIIYYPNTEYNYTKSDNKSEIRYLWLHFSGFYVETLLNKCGLSNNKIEHIGINEHVINDFSQLFRDFIIRDNCFEDALASKLVSILTRMSREMYKEKENDSGERLFHSIEFIHKYFSTNISVEKLAEMEHLSVSHYRTVFYQIKGMSPINYIITVRINRAGELLGQTDLSIKEVAKLSGYDDPLYFSRIFKKRTGYTPGEYRRMNY